MRLLAALPSALLFAAAAAPLAVAQASLPAKSATAGTEAGATTEPVAPSTSTFHLNTPPGGIRTFDFAQLTAADTFTPERGYGFDLGTAPSLAVAQASVPAKSAIAGTEAGATPSTSSQPVAQASLPAVPTSATPRIAGTEAAATPSTPSQPVAQASLPAVPTSAAPRPFYFSVAVPEGNYRVTVTFGDAAAPSANAVKAESRQLLLESLATQPGEFVTRTFTANVRNASLPPPPQNAPGGTAVLLNPREVGLLRWDDKLTLEFNGAAPRIRSVEIAPAPAAPTVFLAGDSTVTDQPFEPAAGWGQMLPRFLRADVAVANHAESGETLKSFLSELRLAKILSQLKAGDFLFLQFGHNDEKKQWPQTYVEARTTYKAYLRAFIAEARLRGATPVLVTSMQRRTFDDHGKIKNTHGDYPAAVRELAAEEKVALVDLDRASTAFYEALGPGRAPLAFSADGKDATHHNNYGGFQLAKVVAQALRDAGPELAALVVTDFAGFDPAHPDAPETFVLPASPARSDAALRGN